MISSVRVDIFPYLAAWYLKNVFDTGKVPTQPPSVFQWQRLRLPLNPDTFVTLTPGVPALICFREPGYGYVPERGL